ncbi:MAG: hypothetical protein PHG35_05715 [Dehalococcoidales bacterium]|nr:hypothetical protein [Dehalococcoidales bacterium]
MSNAYSIKFVYHVLSITIVICLLFGFVTLYPATALAATPAKWSKVNIPSGGLAGGWVLAGGSDVKCLTAAIDGTLYAYGAGLTDTLLKSTDGGKRWSAIGNVRDAITGIAVSPADPAIIYYATVSSVYRSADGGIYFQKLPDVPTRAGAVVTSISVTWLNNNIIAVATADANPAEFGGVYIFDEGEFYHGWADAAIGDYDVYALSFSPDYPASLQLVAVVSNEADTFVFNKMGNADWNTFIGLAQLNRDNCIPPASVVAIGAAIAFPEGYQSYAASSFFVGINTGTAEGDVYKITTADTPNNSLATDLNCGMDVSALAAHLDTQQINLIAGSASTGYVCISRDGGASWAYSQKNPTGNAVTSILFASDFDSSGSIYAATSGNSSALSISHDMGLTWNQISLIDAAITTLKDFAPSPDSSQLNTLFLITSYLEGSLRHSLWRSLNDGASWERILSSDSTSVDSLSLVSLPPEYSPGCLTLFVYGASNGKPVIWKSQDNGQSFLYRPIRDPSTGTSFNINVWTVADADTLYLGSADGAVYTTADSGYSYLQCASAGGSQLNSLALSPGFANDGAILAGNIEGGIYFSDNRGYSFVPLPLDAASPPLEGAVTVAFDPNFTTSRTVYAASDVADSGIYRFIIGTSEEWESIVSSLPVGASINRLSVSAAGVLYAANGNVDGGMERCLNPRYSLTPLFESISRGLSDGAKLYGLWQRNGQLWSIDLHNIKLMTFLDTLTSPVTLVAPDNASTGIGVLYDHAVKDISIAWDTLTGATNYEWQCSFDSSFSTIPADCSGTASGGPMYLPPLQPATTYYWRVRACSPAFSLWSEKWSFTTIMDTATLDLILESPSPGATGISIKPVFQWTGILGAEAYEMLIATDADFFHTVILKIGDYALKTNAWNCDVNLDGGTVYYWKIRAVTASTRSAWSSVGIFTTVFLAGETVPSTIPQPELLGALATPKIAPSTSATTPASSGLVLDIPVWAFYLFGGLISIVLLSLTIVLIIVIKLR